MLLPDQAVRERAATASDCNLVVNAGAGTGKTTLLVDRFLHILFRPDRICPLSQIVALTFTNKAAQEMKVRLRSRLFTMRELELERFGAAGMSAHHYDDVFVKNLKVQHGLSREQVADMADRTLQEFERAQIVTIHGFAAHLLRLFPVEAQVDPSFQEDDGARLRQQFEERWDGWLNQELGPAGHHHDLWRRMLSQSNLSDIEGFARAFLDELVPIPESPWPAMPHGVPSSLKHWLMGLAETARTFRQGSSKSGTIEKMLEAAVTRLEELAQFPIGRISQGQDGREYLDRSVPPKTSSWSQGNYERAKSILKIARASYGPEIETLGSFVSLLIPFIAECRQGFVESGWISFNGLLARARTLLRDYPDVRREVKSHIGALLVDEFQDTDPVQYELILFLAEARGQEARDWRSVRLEPGKLFIVGDPKQSIYAFRRADIEAYDVVIQDRVMAGGGRSEQYSLQCNFRSHADLLTPINACFTRLFPQQAMKGVQPQYEALLSLESDSPRLPHERMEVRLVLPSDAEADAAQATRNEADALARWLKEEVINVQEICVNGVPVRIKPGHVAVLLRTLTQLRVYLEAFRRYGLPYLTEGEKHFFERQEIRDCLCILRVLAFPHDRIALVGVLRSPVGGCSDLQIAQLFHEQHWIFWEDHENRNFTPPVYQILRELRHQVQLVPLSEMMDIVFQKLPILELSAATEDGEQAVANILRLRDMVQELAVDPDLTFRGLVEQLMRWIDEKKPEAEASLSEETLGNEGDDGAIRVLNIHKAKGLEFPMVIVAGLHQGTGTEVQSEHVWVTHDWLTDLVGFRMGHVRSLSGLFVESKLAERIRAEKVRLLYVALTRAQRRLVLSAGLPSSRAWQRGSLLALIDEGLGLDLEGLVGHLGDQPKRLVSVGGCDVPLTVINGNEPQARQAPWNPVAWKPLEDRFPSHLAMWKRQQHKLADCHQSPLFMSPTMMIQREERRVTNENHDGPKSVSLTNTVENPGTVDNRRIVGIMAHRVLQEWDFDKDPDLLPAWIDDSYKKYCATENLSFVPEQLDDLQTIFAKFVRSETYTRLCEADILGREVPFSVSWLERRSNDPVVRPHVMKGVIDLVYRWRVDVWVADYKTDQVSEKALHSRAEQYAEQVEIYRSAVARSIEMELKSVKAQLIFLRTGQALDIKPIDESLYPRL